ncbi:hypothetical protein [Streptomyces sp. NPDC101455]
MASDHSEQVRSTSSGLAAHRREAEASEDTMLDTAARPAVS